ncbi:O-antigen ligase family protein [bacterium]|nr:O-antigen ligase family protein [bacterium]MBT4251080.1 O-antigen ligase family protein [bacterium]MBT4597922.1 O-antigen ligase family protein [bacterium]MBT6753887.1 O-antigen ligase family protein [bacterium]MBT7037316.1 O-antigen ligase family protein [bacterium]
MSSFLAISGVIFFFLDKLTFDGRLQIFLNSPNALAMILTPGIIILLAFLHSKKGFLYIFILLLLFFHIFSTIATLSFGALLSLSFLVVFFIFKKTTQIEWSRAYLILSLVVILFSVFLLFLAPLSSMLGYEQKKPASSTDSRIMIYDVTKQIISEHLFWGIGPGNFQKHYLLNQANYPPYPEWAVPHPHNNILLTIAEGGVFALLGLLLLLTNRFDPTKVSYGVFLLFLLAYLLLHGIIDTTIWKNDTAVIFWLFLGILNFHNTKLLK